jgi:O-antigen chain-terminating methyltransferase
MNINPLDEEYYLKFENTFRGSRKEIVERLRIYMPLLSTVKQASKGQLYGIDIGCGRGEWLELCNDHNVKMIGVDLNPSMVQFCLEQGRHAIQDDAKSYLERQPDMSCGMISLFHVIEHLDRKYLLELIVQALRVLKPSGILLMETPNSDNLLVASKGFYADPTHLRPIHPETTCFELMYLGYSWAKAYYINGHSSYRESDPLGLTSLLAGTALDVVIIAQKSGHDGQLQPEDTWSEALRENETTMQAATRIDSEKHQQILQFTERCKQIEAMANAAINSAELAHQNIALSQQSIEIVNLNIELAQQRITALYNSRIWKATDPLRRLITALRAKKAALLKYIYRNSKHHQP